MTPPVSQSVVPPSTGGINLDPVKSENDKIYPELAAAKARILSVSELCDLTTATPDTGPLNIDEAKTALQKYKVYTAKCSVIQLNWYNSITKMSVISREKVQKLKDLVTLPCDASPFELTFVVKSVNHLSSLMDDSISITPLEYLWAVVFKFAHLIEHGADMDKVKLQSMRQTLLNVNVTFELKT